MKTKMDFSPHTDVLNHGQIRSMRIPPGWKDGPSETGGIGFRGLRTFLAPDDHEVVISLFYRGFPISEEGSAGFRRILAEGAKTIYIARDGKEPSESEQLLFSDLREVLGNAGNNQVINRKTDWRGASFNVTRVEVLDINGRNLLSVQGRFRDPDVDERLKEFAGLFVDTNPEEQQCGVQEIFIEAPNAERFARYLSQFNEAIRSITWK